MRIFVSRSILCLNERNFFIKRRVNLKPKPLDCIFQTNRFMYPLACFTTQSLMSLLLCVSEQFGGSMLCVYTERIITGLGNKRGSGLYFPEGYDNYNATNDVFMTGRIRTNTDTQPSESIRTWGISSMILFRLRFCFLNVLHVRVVEQHRK